MLHNGSICHGERRNPKSKDNPVDGREWNAHLAEKRVDPAVEYWNENDDRNLPELATRHEIPGVFRSYRIEILHQVVGNSMAFHLTGLGNEIAAAQCQPLGSPVIMCQGVPNIPELTIHQPVDWIDGENSASNQCSLQLINKVIVPRHCLCDPVCSEPGRFGSIFVAVSDHEPDALESIRDN